MAHHGAETTSASDLEFINAVRPSFAFSSSKWAGRGHHHPRCSVINTLNNSTFMKNARLHNEDCWDKGTASVVTKKLNKAIWSTMPGPNDNSSYIIAIAMGDSQTGNTKVRFQSHHADLPGLLRMGTRRTKNPRSGSDGSDSNRNVNQPLPP